MSASDTICDGKREVDDTLVVTLSDEIERVMMLDVNPHRANAKTVRLDAKGQGIIIASSWGFGVAEKWA